MYFTLGIDKAFLGLQGTSDMLAVRASAEIPTDQSSAACYRISMGIRANVQATVAPTSPKAMTMAATAIIVTMDIDQGSSVRQQLDPAMVESIDTDQKGFAAAI